MPATKKPNQAKPVTKPVTKAATKVTSKAVAKPAKTAKADTQVDRTSNLDQLSHKLRDLRQDLIRHLNQVRAGATTNVRRSRHLRRHIARHLTVMNEKRRGRASDSTETPDQPAPTSAAGPKPATKAAKPPKGKS